MISPSASSGGSALSDSTTLADNADSTLGSTRDSDTIELDSTVTETAGITTAQPNTTPEGTAESAASEPASASSVESLDSTSLPAVDAGGSPDAAAPDAPLEQSEIGLELRVADVFSGHPTPFALVTAEGKQFVAYYDERQRLTVAERTLGETIWSYRVLPTSVGWDSHNYIAMAVDEAGHIHVSGNMHNVPLVYFRSTAALDTTTLEQERTMVGSNEQSMTYPEFFIGPDGALVYAYRDGGSGSGDHIFNRYSTQTESWSRLLDTALTDGEGQRNAYPVGPFQDLAGGWHLVWVWRDTPDAATNHDLSYARSNDLKQWYSGAGTPVTLPIRLSTADVVDPVPAGGGMINNNTKIGFDAQGRPTIVYHKYDASGATQLYNARLENDQWVVHQTSNWDYRWDFGGNGTLVFEIEVEGVVVQPDGTLTQRYYHQRYGGWGAFRLDPETLAAVEDIPPPSPYPQELDTPESSTPNMVVRWQRDWSRRSGDDAPEYLLRWETLPSNRDEPRATVPPPTELRVYGF